MQFNFLNFIIMHLIKFWNILIGLVFELVK